MTRLVVTTPSTLTQEGELRLCEEIASLLDALQVPAVVEPELRCGEPDLGHPALRAVRARWRLR